MNCDTSTFDQKLLGFWCAAREIYNVAVKCPSEEMSKLDSVRATSFFVQHSYRFADASLMLAANNDLVPAVALMRTAIETQARANHLISFKGKEREDRAAGLFRLSELSGKRFVNLMANSIRSAANIQNCPPKIREVANKLCPEPAAESEALRKERESLQSRWKYGTVIERRSFGDTEKNLRTPFQQIQHTLDVAYNLGSFCLHPDLTSLRLDKMHPTNEIMADAAAVAVCVVYCYLVAIGRQNDPRFNQLVTEYNDYLWSKAREVLDSLPQSQ